MASHRVEAGSGWISFAGIMILLAGIFNVIDGLVALNNSNYFVNNLVFGDLRSWGWTVLILGAVEILTAALVFSHSAVGAVAGITVALLNAVGQLMFLRTYPFWSVVIIAIDVLVIYGLAVYGFGSADEARG
jgi:hypothetical protein